MSHVNILLTIDWENLNNIDKESLIEILNKFNITIDDKLDKNELVWLLRLLAHQYLNHKRYYIHPLCYDLYQITQKSPFKLFPLEQNIINRNTKNSEARLIDKISI